jgi:uncharacterized membrane protein YgcG
MMPWLKTIALLGVGVLCVPVFGAETARPGTVNYVEGAAYLEGRQLNAHDVGSVGLDPGEMLRTAVGKVEILLTPGVYLRLDSHSAVKMISPDLTLTQVELVQGRAGVEVDEIYPQNNLQIIDGGVATQLVKTGYYEFDASHPTVLVFSGKAEVEAADGKFMEVKGHHAMTLAEGVQAKSMKFNSKDARDSLYNWSYLRSQYLAEDNNRIAGQYAGVAGFYPGWYWDPYGWNYTFIGMNPFWSPFGFGFYPPWWGGFYGGYGHGHYGHGGYVGGGEVRGGFSGGGGRGGGGGGRR